MKRSVSRNAVYKRAVNARRRRPLALALPPVFDHAADVRDEYDALNWVSINYIAGVH